MFLNFGDFQPRVLRRKVLIKKSVYHRDSLGEFINISHGEFGLRGLTGYKSFLRLYRTTSLHGGRRRLFQLKKFVFLSSPEVYILIPCYVFGDILYYRFIM